MSFVRHENKASSKDSFSSGMHLESRYDPEAALQF
jgi:hypothetical protein